MKTDKIDDVIKQDQIKKIRKENLQAHYDKVNKEIADQNDRIMDNPNIPAKELGEIYKRLAVLADTSIYLRNLYATNFPPVASPIVKADGKPQLASV